MRQKQNDTKPDGWLQAKFSHKAICYVSEEPTDAEMEETVDNAEWRQYRFSTRAVDLIGAS